MKSRYENSFHAAVGHKQASRTGVADSLRQPALRKKSAYRPEKSQKKSKPARAEENYSSDSFVSSVSADSGASSISSAASGVAGREIVSFMTTSLTSA